MKKSIQAAVLAAVTLSATGCLQPYSRDLGTVWDEVVNGDYPAFAARLELQAYPSSRLVPSCDETCFNRIRWSLLQQARNARFFAPSHHESTPTLNFSPEGVPRLLQFHLYVGGEASPSSHDLFAHLRCPVEVVAQGLVDARPNPQPANPFVPQEYFFVTDAVDYETFLPADMGEEPPARRAEFPAIADRFLDRILLAGLEMMGRSVFQVRATGCKINAMEFSGDAMSHVPDEAEMLLMEQYRQEELARVARGAAESETSDAATE